MNKSFYFLRHGQTDWNKQKIATGQSDVSLNNTGKRQAAEVFLIVKKLDIDRIYTSPLKRAVQTAQIVGTGLPVIVDNGLMERKLGSLGGQPKSLKKTIIPQNIEDEFTFESRVRQAMARISSTPNIDALPLLVSHGGVFKILVKMLVQNSQITAANCGLFLFRYIPQTNSWSLDILSTSKD